MSPSALRGKRTLITGATGGVGQELARVFAPISGPMLITGRNAAKLAELTAELGTNNGHVLTEVADFTRDADLGRVIDTARSRLGGVDVLINCAGIFPVNALAESSLAEFDHCFALNVRAPFALCHAFAPAMVSQRWGRIVNVGSSSAYAGFKDTSVYCASKHALLGFSRALHDELKPHNIRVFCVSPGSVKTEMGRQVRGQTFETFLDPTEIATFILDLASADGPMIAEEVRLNRMVIR